MDVRVNEPANYWHLINLPGNNQYEISIDGKVRKTFKNGKKKMLTPFRRNNKRNLFVKITIDGKSKDYTVFKLLVNTFVNEIPKGKVPYHKELSIWNNHRDNIGFITREELGKLTARMSGKRKPVIKIDEAGRIVETYVSVREAGIRNNMSYQTIADRCHNRIKKPFALDGYNYQFEE